MGHALIVVVFSTWIRPNSGVHDFLCSRPSLCVASERGTCGQHRNGSAATELTGRVVRTPGPAPLYPLYTSTRRCEGLLMNRKSSRLLTDQHLIKPSSFHRIYNGTTCRPLPADSSGSPRMSRSRDAAVWRPWLQ